MKLQRMILPALTLMALIAGRSTYAGLTFTYTSFDPPMGPPISVAYGVSANGTIVGGYADNDGVSGHGYILKDGNYTTLDYTSQEAGSQTYLYSINNAGDATGYYYDPANNLSSFIYHDGLFISPSIASDVPGSTGTAYANISESGQVVTQYHDASGILHSAIYDVNTGKFTLLPDNPNPNGIGTGAVSIGMDGRVVGLYVGKDGHTHGSILSNGMYTTIEIPGAIGSGIDSITSTGLLSGNYFDSSHAEHGFIYDMNSETFYNIQYPGSTFATNLMFGNSDNEFVGFYFDADENPHSFLVQVQSTPEPGSLVKMAGLAATLLPAWLIRRRSVRQ